MKTYFIYAITIALTLILLLSCTTRHSSAIKRIAHRGGVVESDSPENSREALLKAAEQGYWAVELDMRITKDSLLITHHDRDFKKDFNIDKLVSDVTWSEVDSLKSTSGTKVQQLEEALSLCAEKGLNVMIDNKIEGFSTRLFEELVHLLDKYNLRENALMIGTTASTEFFTGKIRLSCTREQLEQNRQRTDYNPENYYLFENPTAEDAAWAKQNRIMVVGVLNEWALPQETQAESVKAIIQSLSENGIHYIQLDSKFDEYLINLGR